MAKIIKEIIIMLLICLVGILLFAVAFYKFIPSRKVVAQVITYAPNQEVQQLLDDKIDETQNEVLVTYEVTTKDLNNYENEKIYIPGKANPFASAPDDADIGGSSTGTSNNNNTTNIDNPNSFIRDNGTK